LQKVTLIPWYDRETYLIEFLSPFKYLSNDALKHIKRAITNLEEQLAKYEIHWLEDGILFIKKRKSEGFDIQEIHCEDCDRYFYILSDMVCYCPYCGSTNVRFCTDVSVEARYL